jgi:hypothetical protein
MSAFCCGSSVKESGNYILIVHVKREGKGVGK